MDRNTFSDSINKASLEIVGQLYYLFCLPRSLVYKILNIFTSFLRSSHTSLLFHQVIHRLEYFGESPNNIAAYKSMFEKLQNPFGNIDSEHKCLQELQKIGTYIPPKEIEIDVEDGSSVDQSIIQKIAIQLFPLRHILKKFLEIPRLFDHILSYLNFLDNDVEVSNIMQGEYWKSKKRSFENKLLWPLLLYQDDFETNNPLGSHKGLGKVGGVYVVLPFLPPNMISKTENIFPLILYKSHDENIVPLRRIFTEAVQELIFLEKNGIEVTTPTGPVKIYFSLMSTVGDNVAIHTILGFLTSFSSNYPCRFCLIHKQDINSVFSESSCNLRNAENYVQNLHLNDASSTGIGNLSVLHDLTRSPIELLTVDLMHDIAEGIWEYDLGLILHYFILIMKLFTIQDFNERINQFYYGKDVGRNKPRPITIHQVKKSFVKMSASEAFCLLRNIGVMIGDYIAKDNKHWRLIILLKEILDIVTATSITDNTPFRLEALIQEYLTLLVQLFPGSMEPKHHLLLHYPRMMKLLGPFWPLSSMRCESKNRDFKMTSNVSLSRLNICKTMAIKHQLQFSCRLQSNASLSSDLYEKDYSDEEITVQDIPQIYNFHKLLPLQVSTKITELRSIYFQGNTVAVDVIVMLPTEEEHQLLVVHFLFEDYTGKLHIIVKDITEFTYYDEHSQALLVHENALSRLFTWRVLKIEQLNLCSFSRIVRNIGENKQYIPKRWK